MIIQSSWVRFLQIFPCLNFGQEDVNFKPSYLLCYELSMRTNQWNSFPLTERHVCCVLPWSWGIPSCRFLLICTEMFLGLPMTEVFEAGVNVIVYVEASISLDIVRSITNPVVSGTPHVLWKFLPFFPQSGTFLGLDSCAGLTLFRAIFEAWFPTQDWLKTKNRLPVLTLWVHVVFHARSRPYNLRPLHTSNSPHWWPSIHWPSYAYRTRWPRRIHPLSLSTPTLAPLSPSHPSCQLGILTPYNASSLTIFPNAFLPRPFSCFVLLTLSASSASPFPTNINSYEYHLNLLNSISESSWHLQDLTTGSYSSLVSCISFRLIPGLLLVMDLLFVSPPWQISTVRAIGLSEVIMASYWSWIERSQIVTFRQVKY